MRKLIAFMCILLQLSTFCVFAESENISLWAVDDFNYMTSLGITKVFSKDENFKRNIKRIEFAEILLATYEEYTKKSIKTDVIPFSDTISPAATAMYVLGIADGDENKKFNPQKSLARQEAAKMLYNFDYALKGKRLTAIGTISHFYEDSGDIAIWAIPYVDALGSASIMGDCGDNMFCPKAPLTIEQAVVLCSRIIKYDGDTYEEVSFLPEIADGPTATVSWKEFPDSETYRVSITEYRNTTHGEEMGAKDPENYIVRGTKEITLSTKPVRRYVVSITDGKRVKTEEIKTGPMRSWSENLAEIESYTLPTSDEEAKLLLEDVEIDIWKLSGGKKVASKTTITVHKAIAEKVKAVFDEIFAGDEKFPINSVSAYSYRGGKSEHNYGTAIDINPNENYCIYTNGVVVGEFYKPYENPYSILPFGEVVTAFEKYGFNWGADTWSGNRDYMHFSYCGT